MTQEEARIEKVVLDVAAQEARLDTQAAMLSGLTRRLNQLEDRMNALSEVSRRRTTNISQLRRRVADLEEEMDELQQRETL